LFKKNNAEQRIQKNGLGAKNQLDAMQNVFVAGV
jgi:hypothetical protein